MEIVRRIVFSTFPQRRASVLSLFQNPMNLTPTGGLTVNACGIASSTAQDRLIELVELDILTKDVSQKQHEYRLLTQFQEVCAKPTEPLDHVLDATLEASPGGLPGGVRDELQDASTEGEDENQANFLTTIESN
jgi:hypothetical protein